MPSLPTIPQRTPVWTVQLPEPVAAISCAPDSRHYAVGGVDGGLWLVDAAGKILTTLAGHPGGLFQAAWNPREPVIASSGADGCVRIWDPSSAAELEKFPAGASWVEQLAWSPTGVMLACGAGRVLTLWKHGHGVIHVAPEHRSTLSALCWRGDGQRLAAACYGGAHLYDGPTGKPVEVLPWKSSILSLAWSPDQRWLVGGTQENAVQVWELPYEPGGELAMSGYPGKVRELAWHFSSRYLATGGGDTIMVWSCSGKGPAGTTPRILEGHAGRITCLAYQHAGHVLASGGADGNVLFWNAGKTSTAVQAVKLGAPVTASVWTPDGRLNLAGTREGLLAALQAPSI